MNLRLLLIFQHEGIVQHEPLVKCSSMQLKSAMCVRSSTMEILQEPASGEEDKVRSEEGASSNFIPEDLLEPFGGE